MNSDDQSSNLGFTVDIPILIMSQYVQLIFSYISSLHEVFDFWDSLKLPHWHLESTGSSETFRCFDVPIKKKIDVEMLALTCI